MEINKPLVSIIIPTYNRAHLIGETLDSIIAQTYQNWECIVVDDGSSDHTERILQNYCAKDSRFKFYHRPENHLPGGNGARNYGFEKSKGEYIQWFDSDDLMDKNLIRLQLMNLKNKEKNISVCQYSRFNEDFSRSDYSSSSYNLIHSVYIDYILQNISLNLPTLLFQREVLKSYRLNERLFKSQEYEFLQRILRENEENISIIKDSLVNVRRHKESITGKIDKKKIDSLLKVSLIIIEELPDSIIKTNIYNKILNKHLQNLKFAYLKKESFLFFKYLYKIPNFFFSKIYFSFLYLLYYFFNKGQSLYKRKQIYIIQ